MSVETAGIPISSIEHKSRQTKVDTIMMHEDRFSESAVQRDAYENDGVVLIQDLLNDEQLNLISIGIDKIIANPSKRHVDYVNEGEGGQRFFYDAALLSAIEEIETAVRSSCLAGVVAKTMNSSIATAFYVSIFSRSEGALKRTPWHQDLPYWAADGLQACSTWIPLDPVPRSTALEFVRGSHLWDVFVRPDFCDQPREGYLPDENTRAEPFPDIESNRDGYDIIGWEMDPGDGLLFHGMTAHGGSGGLLPGLGRRAISIQWLGDDMVYTPKEGKVDPDFTVELTAAGLQTGGPVACDLCPVLWPER